MSQLNIPIFSSFNAGGVNSAIKQLGVLGGAVSKLKATFGVAAGSVVAFQAATAGLNFAKEAVIQARDLERNYAALDVVFGDLSTKMRQFTVDAQNIGLSQSDAARASTFLGSVLKQAGFEMGDVADQTQNLVGLASDLAITYGYDVSEALTGMTALFRGEYDPIEKFGVAMKQSEVNAVLAANGQSKLQGAARRNAEQLARLALLLDRTRDAQGQFTEQGNSLFAAQSRLAASFENLQAAVGQALIPVLSKAVVELEPMIKSLLPQLAAIFTQIGVGIGILVPYLPAVFEGLKTIAEIAVNLLKAFNFLLPIIAENIAAAAVMIATYKGLKFIIPLIQAMRVQLALAALEWKNGAIAATLFGTASRAALGPVGLLLLAAGAVAFALTKVATEDHTTETSTLKLNDALAATGGWQAYTTAAGQAAAATAAAAKAQKMFGTSNTLTEFAYQKGLPKPKEKSALELELEKLLKNFENFSGKIEEEGKKAGAAAKDAIKEFYTSVADEASKQRARGILGRMGLSEGLVESIVGSGENWRKVFLQVKNSSASAVSQLISDWSYTKAGIDEATASAKAFEEEQQKIADAMKEIADRANDARKSILASLGPVGALGKARNEMGEFESEAATAFSGVRDSIQDAFDTEAITKAAFDDITKFINNSEKLLLSNARERDLLAARRGEVESLYRSVENTFLSFARITDEIDSQTETVTQSSMQVIDGLQVTVSRTFEVTKQATSVTQNFKTMVDKARNFVSVLKQLKSQGLNAELFNQIVESGVEAGTATAEGILAGGPGAITEVNKLFGELQTISKDAAEMTTVVMFNNGKDVAGGFLAGLKSQEKTFADMATTLATAFAKALTDQINAAIAAAKLAAEAAAGGSSTPYLNASEFLNTIQTSPDVASFVSQGASASATLRDFADMAGLQPTPVILQLDGKVVAQSMINYERTNGAVWQRA
jgi:hypothetical protein